MRWRSWILLLLGVAGAARGALYALESRYVAERLRAAISAAAASALRADTEIGAVEVDALDSRIRITHLTAAARGYTPFFTLTSAEITVNPLPLLWGTLSLERVVLEHPVLRYTREEKVGSNLPAPAPTAAKEQSSGVELEQLLIQDGVLQAIVPGTLFAEVRGVSANVWRGANGEYRAELSAAGGSIDLPRLHESITRLELSGSLQGDQLYLGHAALETERLQLGMQGRGAGDAAGLARLPLPVLGQALGLPHLSGEVTAALRLDLNGDEPTLRAQLDGTGVQLDAYQFGDVSMGVALRPSALTLEDAQLRVGAGLITANASLGLDPALPLAVTVESQAVPVEEFFARMGLPGSWVVTSLDSTLTLEGQLARGFHLNGTFSARAPRLEVLTRSYALPRDGAPYLTLPAYETALALRLSADKVEIEQGSLRLAETALDYEGWVSFDQRIDLTTSGFLDFGELGALTGVHYQGTGQVLRGGIEGWLDDPRLFADLSLSQFGIEGYPLGTLRGGLRYEWPGLRFVDLAGEYKTTAYQAEGALDLSKGSLPIALEVEFLRAQPRDLAEMLQLADYLPDGINALGQGKASVRGPIETPRITGAAALSGLDLYGERIPSGEMDFSYQVGGDLVIASASFTDGTGTLALSGTMTDAGALDFSLHGEDLDSAQLDVVDLRAAQVEARYSLDAALSGSLDDPRLAARLRAPQTTVAGLRFSETDLTVELDGARAVLSGTVLEKGRVEGEVAFLADLPYRLALDTAPIALEVFFPQLAWLHAAAGGEIALSGSLLDPLASQGTARLHTLQAAYDGLPLALVSGAEVTLQEGALSLAPTRLSIGEDVLTLHAAASYPLGGTLSVDFATSTDLLALRELPQVDARLPSALTAVTGEVSITGGAELGPSGFSLLAAARLRGLSLSLDGLPQPLEGLDLDLTITERAIFLDRLKGTFSGGTLRASGELSLRGLRPDRLDLALSLDRAELRRPDDGLAASASAELRLRGTMEALALSGDVEIDRLRYDQSIDVLPSLSELLAGKPLPTAAPVEEAPAPSPTAAGPSLALDLLVTSPGPIEIENNLARAELHIDDTDRPFRVRGDLSNPAPSGRVALVLREEDPPTLKFRDTELTLTRGVLSFDGDLDPALDATAEARVREVEIRVRATGTLSNPQLVTTSEPALSEDDIILLVTLGVTRRELSELDAGKSLSLLAPELLSELTGVRDEVNRILPESVSLGLTTGFSERDNAFVPKLQLTWDPAEELRVRVTSNFLSLREDNQAEIQLKLRDDLSFTSTWEQQGVSSSQTGVSLGDLGFDLRWRREFARQPSTPAPREAPAP